MNADAVARLNAALEDRYSIDRRVGEGGMATVYLARDLRHNRGVALKILKPEIAEAVGADRFLREIETTASLQHPHILPLFDSGESDGVVYYVMPYVEGESLRDRLDDVIRLPVEEAVKLARSVANALEYAHRQGVIHRDIKPANILLHGDEPVVADFGIALAATAEDSARFTQAGSSLGTLGYMSPEQAAGDQQIDGRSDIYALGCMLYEMLAGEQPYSATTASARLAKVLTEDPRPIRELRRSVPPNVAAVTEKALERLPADRFQHAEELARALDNPAFRHHGSSTTPERESVSQRRWKWAAIGATAVAGIAILFATRAPEPVELPILKVSLALSGEELVVPANGSAVTISRDGSMLVYGAYGGPDENDRWRLWARHLDELEAMPITGTEEGVTPALSPDGSEVAFTVAARRSPIQIMPLAGGSRRSVGEDVIRGGIDWGADGMLYYTRLGQGLSRVPATGGDPEIVTVVDTASGETGHRWPQLLPGEEAAVFSIGRPGGVDTWDIAAVRLGSGEHRILTTGLYPRYLRSGHLLWVLADGTAMAAPFDRERLELTGAAMPVLDSVNLGAFGAADLTVSEDGTLVYVRARIFDDTPMWVDRSGIATEVPGPWDGSPSYPRLSPGGDRMALTVAGASGSDIWIKDLVSGPLSRLTFDGSNYRSSWTPDGAAVTFLSDREGQGIWRAQADGTGSAELLYDDDRFINEGFFAPGGEWLVYRLGSGGDRDLFARRPGLTESAVSLVSSEFEEASAVISPDGDWLAYASDESGQFEVYVRPFPNTGGSKQQVSTAGGRDPLWARSGTELFYMSAANQLIAVSVDLDPTFTVQGQAELFSTVGFQQIGFIASYDVAPDDQRFLMIRSRSGIGDVKLIQNFFEELRGRLGS